MKTIKFGKNQAIASINEFDFLGTISADLLGAFADKNGITPFGILVFAPHHEFDIKPEQCILITVQDHIMQMNDRAAGTYYRVLFASDAAEQATVTARTPQSIIGEQCTYSNPARRKIYAEAAAGNVLLGARVLSDDEMAVLKSVFEQQRPRKPVADLQMRLETKHGL